MRIGGSGRQVHPGLDPQLSEELFKVGIVDDHFPGLLALCWGLDGTFIKSLKKAHIGDGIFLAARERAAVLLCPGVQRRLHDKDFEEERGAAVGGDHVRKFAAGVAVPLRAIPFEEVVLIDVAVGRRVALDAADGIGARHGRIIGGAAEEVNAGICAERWSQYETAVQVFGSKSELSLAEGKHRELFLR
jgi:hypothetical protein